MGCGQATRTWIYTESEWLSQALWTMTRKKKARERRSISNHKLQMQSVSMHMFFCGRISVFVYASVSLRRSIKMPVISFSLCQCVSVCWCSPLCSCDPWESGWAVTLLICPSRNTAWKMSSEHSQLCLHQLQVPSLLIWQVIITHAPLPPASRSLKHKNEGGGGMMKETKQGH